MRSHYGTIVVGSGYGASVAALRVTEGMSATEILREGVAVFERGREILPGEFPESLADLALDMRSRINPLGFLDATKAPFKADLDVIGASGLGGTSLLNAAITMRPAEIVWRQPEWPEEIRRDFQSGQLSEYFDRAESMLRPTLGENTRSLPKTAAHLANVEPGLPQGELTLNINHTEGFMRFGVQQHACTNCGNCCGGCNVGAKNSTTTNYLPCAKDMGAEVYTRVEVAFVEYVGRTAKAPWRVHLKVYDRSSFLYYTQKVVTADHVFLGAGSAGTTRILLESRENGLELSDRIGSGVSANGDKLGFVYNSGTFTNVAAAEASSSLAPPSRPVGPTITAYAQYGEPGSPIEEQFVLLDGSIPTALAPTAARALAAAFGLPTVMTADWDGMERAGADLIASYPGAKGALAHSMLLLACGHDSSGGRYVLGDGGMYVEWPDIDRERSFEYIEQKMQEYAARMGGVYVPNPRTTLFRGKLQTTHPLGGAPMGSDVSRGVVNHRGQVFDPNGGVYPGLYVVDAAMIPRSLGAPPLATITALAERNLAHFASDRAPPTPIMPPLPRDGCNFGLRGKPRLSF